MPVFKALQKQQTKISSPGLLQYHSPPWESLGRSCLTLAACTGLKPSSTIPGQKSHGVIKGGVTKAISAPGARDPTHEIPVLGRRRCRETWLRSIFEGCPAKDGFHGKFIAPFWSWHAGARISHPGGLEHPQEPGDEGGKALGVAEGGGGKDNEKTPHRLLTDEWCCRAGGCSQGSQNVVLMP